MVGEECLNWGVDNSVGASHLEGPRGGESTACAVLDKVVDEGCRPAYKPGPFGSEWNWLGGRALWWVFPWQPVSPVGRRFVV